LTEIFFSFPSAKNPSQWPSGEKKGFVAPSVLGIARVSALYDYSSAGFSAEAATSPGLSSPRQQACR
jgi:hypothetical protein